MKTIIAGSRTYQLTDHDYQILDRMDITEVVCGGAKGADECGRKWAVKRNLPVKMFPANWDRYGRAAGPIRNQKMANYSEQLIAFWDGKSQGTKSMIEAAKKSGIKKIFIKIRDAETHD